MYASNGGNTNEKELLVLATCFNQQYTFASCHRILQEYHFENRAYGAVWQTLQRGYAQMRKLLNVNELWMKVCDDHFQQGIRPEVQQAFVELTSWNQTSYDPQFCAHQVEEYIRMRLTQQMINGIVSQIQGGNQPDWPDVMKSLKSLNFTITPTIPARATDLDTIWAEGPMQVGPNSVIKSSIPTMNTIQSYGGYNKKGIFQFVASPGVGKSTTLVAESGAAAINGNRVLHVVCGDLTLYDIWVKMMSRLFADEAHSQSNLIRMSRQQIEADIASHNVDGRFNNVCFLAYPAGTLSASALREEAFRIRDEYFGGRLDLIVVDYADNLSREAESMYENSGEIYAQLSKMAWELNCCVLTASQPKANFWENEIIDDQNAAAESGKKHHILDGSFNIGKPTRLIDGSAVAVLSAAKVRRGTGGRKIYLRIHYKNCLIEEIDMARYLHLKKNENIGLLTGPGGTDPNATPVTPAAPMPAQQAQQVAAPGLDVNAIMAIQNQPGATTVPPTAGFAQPIA